jgi:hypothetical protein
MMSYPCPDCQQVWSQNLASRLLKELADQALKRLDAVFDQMYFQHNAETRPLTLDYATPSNVAPEMEQVWVWFDQILGATARTNPRKYCDF